MYSAGTPGIIHLEPYNWCVFTSKSSHLGQDNEWKILQSHYVPFRNFSFPNVLKNKSIQKKLSSNGVLIAAWLMLVVVYCRKPLKKKTSSPTLTTFEIFPFNIQYIHLFVKSPPSQWLVGIQIPHRIVRHLVSRNTRFHILLICFHLRIT